MHSLLSNILTTIIVKEHQSVLGLDFISDQWHLVSIRMVLPESCPQSLPDPTCFQYL